MILEATLENIKQAARALRRGELVSFPTETVYGLGANALNSEAVKQIFKLKGRPSNNPLIVHVASVEAARAVFAPPLSHKIEQRLVKLSSLWPGPLSIVAPKSVDIPGCVTSEQPLVAVRIPRHPVALELLRQVNLPIAAPSANRSNYISPTLARHVADDFGDELSIILDGGSCDVGLESTVVSIASETPKLLRAGGIPAEVIEYKLGESLGYAEKNSQPVSPGMLAVHYSPHTPLYMVGEEPESLTSRRSGLICFDQKTTPSGHFSKVINLSSRGDLEEVARGLYAALRELDQNQLDYIVISECERAGLGLAIMDRISRAKTWKMS